MTGRAAWVAGRRIAALLRPKPLACLVLTVTACGVIAAPARAQLIDDRLAIHGFISQAWARAWENPIAGIPADASTFDYRTVAIQAGYTLGETDRVVIQLNHKRIGESPLEGTENTIRLGWGFYERRIGEGALRVGKVPFPHGLFNEVRDVGTALPFYRAPLHYYTESAETVDGVAVAYRLFARNPLSLHAEAFAGQYDVRIITIVDDELVVRHIDARTVLGAQFWLEIPFANTRIGLGGHRFDETGMMGQKIRGSTVWHASAESNLGPVTARAEHLKVHSDEYRFAAAYAQIGVRLTAALAFNMQAEEAGIHVPAVFGDFELEQAHDRALGISYTIPPGTVLKIETHWFEGLGLDAAHPIFAPLPRARYAMASFAVGF